MNPMKTRALVGPSLLFVLTGSPVAVESDGAPTQAPNIVLFVGCAAMAENLDIPSPLW
jgi:hypothetical protein